MKIGLIPINIGMQSQEKMVGLDAMEAFSDSGVSRVLVPLFALGRDPVAGISQLAEEIVAKL